MNQNNTFELFIKNKIEELNNKLETAKESIQKIVKKITEGRLVDSYKNLVDIDIETLESIIPLKENEKTILRNALFLITREKEVGFSFSFGYQYQDTMNSLYNLAERIIKAYENYQTDDTRKIKEQLKHYQILQGVVKDNDFVLLNQNVEQIIEALENINISQHIQNILLSRLINSQTKEYKNRIIAIEEIELIEGFESPIIDEKHTVMSQENELIRLVEEYFSVKIKSNEGKFKLFSSVILSKKDINELTNVDTDKLRDFLSTQKEPDVDNKMKRFIYIKSIVSAISEGYQMELTEEQEEDINFLIELAKKAYNELEEEKKQLIPYKKLLKQLKDPNNLLFIEEIDMFKEMCKELCLDEKQIGSILKSITLYNEALKTKLKMTMQINSFIDKSLVTNSDFGQFLDECLEEDLEDDIDDEYEPYIVDAFMHEKSIKGKLALKKRDFTEEERHILYEYFKTIKNLPILTEKETKKLYEKMAKSEPDEKSQIRNEIIEGNLKRAFKALVREILSYSEITNIEDLIGLANELLLKFVDTYNNEGIFKDILALKIHRVVLSNLQTHHMSTEVPEYVNILAQKSAILNESELNVTEEKYTLIMNAVNSVRLDENDDIEDEEPSLIYDNFEDLTLDNLTTSMIIEKLLDELDEREKEIIRLRYFISHPMTLEEIAKIFKVSPTRIKQIETKALCRMRKRNHLLMLQAERNLQSKKK